MQFTQTTLSWSRSSQGMTLIEMMIASGLMTVVIMALMFSNYLGIKEDQLIESKAGADDTSRRGVSQMLYDIRTAKGYLMGNYSSSAFTACAINTLQQGSAVQLFPTLVNATNVDTSQYILYYFDTNSSVLNDARLWRISTCSNAVSTSIIASNLIGDLTFYSEDYRKTVQTTRTFKALVHTTLQFCEFQYPLTMVGSNYLFDYYRIDCRATPHLPDGP